MKISIITICFNSAQYLEQTIRSVTGQTYADREYIVIDGGSTDGTVDIVRKYEDKIDKWISEPDHGIADAMNKGLAMANGDYVIFIHSDDYFVDANVISTAVSYMSEEQDVYLFDIFLEKNGERKLHRPRGFNWWMNLKTGVFHQSVICRRDLFEQIGYFDTSFKITMDYDFFLRAYWAGVRAKKIAFPLSVMRLVGISSRCDWLGLRQRLAEERRCHRKNCPSPATGLLYRLYWYFYPAIKFSRSKMRF